MTDKWKVSRLIESITPVHHHVAGFLCVSLRITKWKLRGLEAEKYYFAGLLIIILWKIVVKSNFISNCTSIRSMFKVIIIVEKSLLLCKVCMLDYFKPVQYNAQDILSNNSIISNTKFVTSIMLNYNRSQWESRVEVNLWLLVCRLYQKCRL